MCGTCIDMDGTTINMFCTHSMCGVSWDTLVEYGCDQSSNWPITA